MFILFSVDAQWTSWSGCTTCAICGPTASTGTRTCDDSIRQYGGADCVGESTMECPCKNLTDTEGNQKMQLDEYLALKQLILYCSSLLWDKYLYNRLWRDVSIWNLLIIQTICKLKDNIIPFVLFCCNNGPSYCNKLFQTLRTEELCKKKKDELYNQLNHWYPVMKVFKIKCHLPS